MNKFFRICIALMLLVFILQPAAASTVPLNDANIYVNGAAYVTRSPQKLFFRRFSEKTLNAPKEQRAFDTERANSASGITIEFKTNSPSVKLKFNPEPGIAEKGSFRIMRNGSVYKTISFTAAQSSAIFTVSIDSLSDAGAAVYEIVMPSYSNFSLTGLELAGNLKLLPYTPSKKPILITFGDSITHGRGQDGATYLTYPFQMAQLLDMRLYNLAVGGAKISVPTAEMSGDLPQADVITILIGYNDMNGGSKTVAQFEKDYRELLTMTRNKQKKAKIFCISLLYTKKIKNPKTGVTPDQFRTTVENIVREYQKKDKNLYFIAGEKISSAENLMPGEKTDAVHLTVKGARLLAEELSKEIKKEL